MTASSHATVRMGPESPYRLKGYRRINLPGPEDAAIDRRTGIAYISFQDRWRNRDARGGIATLDLAIDAPEPRILPLWRQNQPNTGARIPWDEAFHPIGLSLLPIGNDDLRLFVVNQRAQLSRSIEVFQVEADGLVHQHTASDPARLRSPNDVAAIDAERFLVTNDAHMRLMPLRILESLAPAATCTVVAYQDRFTVAANRIRNANGIAIDDASGRVYVSELLRKRILVFRQDGNTPLRLRRDAEPIRVDGYPDNLDLDADGNLWVAVHPRLLALSLHLVSPRRHAPSRIQRIELGGAAGGPRVCTVLEDDDGMSIKAASVAALHVINGRHRLVIGAVADNHLLLCDLATQ